MDSGCSILFFEEPIANDIAARVKWGTSQQIVIYEFDPNSGGEKILVDHKALSLAFSERKNRKKLFCMLISSLKLQIWLQTQLLLKSRAMLS